MRRLAFVKLLVTLSHAAALLAASVSPRPPPFRRVPRTLVLEQANVIDGRSNAPLQNMSVVVKDGKIAEVRAAASPIPPGPR